jgi:dCTP deaminase
VQGNVNTFYNRKLNDKYNDRTDKPVESMMWKNTW